MDLSNDSDGRNQVYVGNIPYDVKEDDVLAIFRDYKPVHMKMVRRDQKCFAFIQLTSEENASRAISKLDRTLLYGRALILKPYKNGKNCENKPGASQDMASKPASARTAGHPDKDKKVKEQIVVGHLPFYVTDDLKTVLQSEPNDQEISGNASGHFPAGKMEHKFYVDNLSRDVTKDDLLQLFASYNPLCVWRPQNSEKCAVVDVNSSEDVIQALTHLNGTMFKGSCLTVLSMVDKLNGVMESDMETELPPMPALELVPQPEGGDGGEGPADGRATKNSFVPPEMSGALLVSMLKDCYSDASWLTSPMNLIREQALLVTNVHPGTAYFWAVPMCKEMYATLIDLCNSLAQVEPQLPYLKKNNVQNGMRCLARYTTSGENGTLGRCWVNNVDSDDAVVFFVDYGLIDVLPMEILKPLDDAQYWRTPPLARPFLLLQGHDTADLAGAVVKGRVYRSCYRQRHILHFRAFIQED